jgi:hypothetical protein
MKSIIASAVIIAACLSILSGAYAGTGSSKVLRQYPIANALEVSPQTSIGITASEAYDALQDELVLREGEQLVVFGSRSGLHSIRLEFSDDARTVILTPVTPFAYNEAVTVKAILRLASGALAVDSFTFRTMRERVNSPALRASMRETSAAFRPQTEIFAQALDSVVFEDTLPALSVLVDRNATIGKIYCANFGIGKVPNNTFLLNMDAHGNVVKKQNLAHSSALDFKVQANGTITYFDNALWRFISVDSDWHPIDTFRTANGYLPDQHELLLLPNGGYALLAVSETKLDSTQYEVGMVPNAAVGGNVIQIFDAHHHLTFEWRGIDNYRISDAVHENLADSSIDFQHANSLDIDAAGDIIMSNRHLSEITKISGTTGRILWRLGGAHNQFALQDDSMWFSYQHFARLQPNGHLTLFDNAVFDSVIGTPGYYAHSRALEFELDTIRMTAKAVWQWHHDPETFSVAMGSVQRLPNGRTLIGWGLNYSYAMTEVGRDNSTVFEMTLGPQNVSYRVFKDPVMDSLSVGNSLVNQSSIDFRVVYAHGSPYVSVAMDRPEECIVSVYDVLGREVSAPSSIAASDRPAALQTAGLQPGSYFCTLRTVSGRTATAPFVLLR